MLTDDELKKIESWAGRKGATSDLYCQICGELRLFPNSHKCPPKWQVCVDGDGDDWRDIYAETAPKAAEKLARNVWDSDWGDQITVWVRVPGEMVATEYPVYIEAEPVFSAVSDYHYTEKRPRPTRHLTEETEEA